MMLGDLGNLLAGIYGAYGVLAAVQISAAYLELHKTAWIIDLAAAPM